jgi:uncharacterized protein
MSPSRPAKLLRILISESDRFGPRPLYEVIVDRCRELKIAGATVLRGREGYGETAEMHKAHLVHSDRPILITIVDTSENVALIAAVVEEMMYTGMLATSDVEMIRVQKHSPATSCNAPDPRR